MSFDDMITDDHDKTCSHEKNDQRCVFYTPLLVNLKLEWAC